MPNNVNINQIYLPKTQSQPIQRSYYCHFYKEGLKGYDFKKH